LPVKPILFCVMYVIESFTLYSTCFDDIHVK
jgi:hypothetical protein